MGASAPIIGGLMSAGGALAEGEGKAADLDREAEIQTKNAALARAAAETNAKHQQMISGQKIGSIQADYAASGVTSDSGSVMDILRQSHVNAEMDRLNIIHGGEVRAINAENRANSARAGARNARSAGTMNAFSAIFGGGAKAMQYSGGSSNSNNDYNDYSSTSGGGYGSAGGGGSSGDFSNYA